MPLLRNAFRRKVKNQDYNISARYHLPLIHQILLSEPNTLLFWWHNPILCSLMSLSVVATSNSSPPPCTMLIIKRFVLFVLSSQRFTRLVISRSTFSLQPAQWNLSCTGPVISCVVTVRDTHPFIRKHCLGFQSIARKIVFLT